MGESIIMAFECSVEPDLRQRARESGHLKKGWKRNRGAPRFLTRDKDVDLRKQIALLESLGVIEKSQAAEYSQVHLVRKPDNG
jgi:hypothetical protein